MSVLIVDASAAAAFTIEAQATPASRNLLASWGDHDALAPYVFQLETMWLLLRRERSKREPGLTDTGLAFLREMDIEVQPALTEAELGVALQLAREENMGLYDAMYILLALQTGGGVASGDRYMLEVALRCRVPVVDLRDPSLPGR